MKDLKEILASLSEIEMFDSYYPKWNEYLSVYQPLKYAEDFLSDAAIVQNFQLGSLPVKMKSDIMEVAKKVRTSNDLLYLAAFLHWRHFVDSDRTCQVEWPSISKIFKNPAAFHLLIAIGFMPEYIKQHSNLGIPYNVLLHSCQQVGLYANTYWDAFGQTGIFIKQLRWLHNYFPPKRYFRIGRLEFCQDVFDLPFTIFRNKVTQKTIAFLSTSEPQRITKDGFFEFRTEKSADSFVIDGKLCDTNEKYFSGHKVTSDGRIDLKTSELSRAEWDIVARAGDETLTVHIPSGGNMRPKLVRESMIEALKFFDKYFPDNRIKLLSTHSWIFSSQLQVILPKESNILQFQRMIHLLPAHSAPDEGLWFVFLTNGPYRPTDDLKKDTAMRCQIAEWLNRGNRFRQGAMYITRDEIKQL